MYHYVYKITRLRDQKYYIGVHSSKRLNNRYMGSGVLIRKAIKEEGREAFKKEILEVFDAPEQAFALEAELVGQKEKDSDMCFNLAGGGAGWGPERTITPEGRKRMGHRKGVKWSEEHKAQMSERMKGRSFTKEARTKMSEYAKNRTPEHREKLGKAFRGRKTPESVKQKQREVYANRPLTVCPHCGKSSTSPAIMKRWHFDSCKERIKS